MDTATPSTPTTPSSPAKPPSEKVEIILKPVGDAPIMKNRKYSVEKTKTVGWILSFIRRYLRLESGDSLFLYVNQAFAPSPDHTVAVLADCFHTDGKLVLHYATTPAWG